MDKSSITAAVEQICEEKGVPLESVISTIEAALAAAYRKDFGEKNQNIKVDFELETGESKIFDVKEVVEDISEEELEAMRIAAEEEKEARENKKSARMQGREEKIAEKVIAKAKDKKETDSSQLSTDNEEEVKKFNPKTDIQLSDAKKIKKSYKLGDIVKTTLEIPGDFGRMAAQTAKQVIVQKLRETERATMYEEFKDKEGEILMGTVQRKEGSLVLVDLGRLTALLPPEEQIRNENYTPGTSLKVYIMSVRETTKGPEVIVSRAHTEIVRTLFFLEIPEISNGVVEIKSVSREAGARSKIAVWTDQENIDPIGSCIGQRGARIQTIISELKGEKVDIIKYSEDPVEYISNALSPAKIINIQVNEDEHTATATVVEDQLSLAIGKAGQNVRLAAKLTGWKIDIVSEDEDKDKDEAEDEDKDDNDSENDDEEEEKEDKKEDIEEEEKEDKKEKKEPKAKAKK